jgi:hypothetical protein
MLAAFLDAHPTARHELVARRVLSSDMIRRIEMCGRDQIVEELIYATSIAERQLMKLPLSEQKLALDQGVEVLEYDEKNTRKIPVAALTPAQTKQVFASGTIRSLAEQRSIIQERKRRECRPVNVVAAYHIHRGTVVITQPLKMGIEEAAQMLNAMIASK